MRRWPRRRSTPTFDDDAVPRYEPEHRMSRVLSPAAWSRPIPGNPRPVPPMHQHRADDSVVPTPSNASSARSTRHRLRRRRVVGSSLPVCHVRPSGKPASRRLRRRAACRSGSRLISLPDRTRRPVRPDGRSHPTPAPAACTPESPSRSPSACVNPLSRTLPAHRCPLCCAAFG